MGKNQKKIQKQKQKKASKHKAKRSLLKKRVLSRAPSKPDEIFDKVDSALEFAEAGNLQRASRMIQSLSEEYPENSHVHYGLGVLALIAEDSRSAAAHFEFVIEKDPSHIIAHYNRAAAYQKQVNIRMMVESLNNVVALKHLNIKIGAKAQERLNWVSEMIEKNDGISLDQYIKAQIHFDIGFAHMEKGEYDKAIDPFEKALAINANPPQVHGNLGLCYAVVGEKEKSIALLKKALEIDPKYEVATHNLSNIEKLNPGEKLEISSLLSTDYYLDFPRS